MCLAIIYTLILNRYNSISIFSDGETIVTPIVTTPGLDCSFTMKFLALASLCFVGLILADEKEKADDYGTVIGIDLGTTYSW